MDGRDAGYSMNNPELSRRARRWALRGGVVVVAASMLLTGFMQPAVCRAQAMGKITLDGPSPLPMAAVRPAEADKGDTVKPGMVAPMGFGMPRGADLMANLGTTAVAAAPAPAAPVTSAAPVVPAAPTAPSNEVVARTPAPLPVPQELPKPPATNPVAAPSALEPAPGPGAAAAKPGIEQQSIRSNGGEAVKGASSEAKNGGMPGLGFGQVVAALAIVVGLIFVGRALVRKFVPGAGASSGKGVIEVLARHPLAKNQALVLVRIGSQIVALNQGRESSESVLVISEPMEVARIIGQIEGKNPASIQAGFNRLLANARMDLEGGGAEEPDLKSMGEENLDEQLEEMAAAKRQLMELRQHVRSVRDSLPRE